MHTDATLSPHPSPLAGGPSPVDTMRGHGEDDEETTVREIESLVAQLVAQLVA